MVISLLKKISMVFLFILLLNKVLMADMLFYYSAAVLPSIIAQNKKPVFTQEIVSANPWYRVEYEVDVAYCNGVFTYDGNNTLTVTWNDNGVPGSGTVSYSIVDGKVVTPHDGKTETETLLTFKNSVITTDSVTIEEDGSTYSGNVKWFQNQVDAEAFLTTYGEQSCF